MRHALILVFGEIENPFWSLFYDYQCHLTEYAKSVQTRQTRPAKISNVQQRGKFSSDILSHASETGSPTNRSGSDKMQDTGPGIFWSVHRWIRPTGEPPIDKLDNHLVVSMRNLEKSSLNWSVRIARPDQIKEDADLGRTIRLPPR